MMNEPRRTPAIDGASLLCWVELELPNPPWPDSEPFLGFVYMDPQAGLSARGGRSGDPRQIEKPAVTLRLPLPLPGRALSASEAGERGLPVAPPWLTLFGPQPPAEGPWRSDPALAGRFHASFPDDLQVLVHDGEPRRTGRHPELCWVRVVAREDGPARPGMRGDDGAPPRRTLYVAQLLNQPHQLNSLRLGEMLRFYPDAGGMRPVMVTADYLAERDRWEIEPCASCGLAEGLDPPSVMARTRFPDSDGAPLMFTAICPLCGGSQVLRRTDGLP